MKKTIAILLPVVMLLGVLAGCASSSDDSSSSTSTSESSTTSSDNTVSSTYEDVELSTSGTEQLKDIVFYQTSELESFDIFYSNAANTFQILANCIDPLITNDKYGNMVACLAESWGTEDNGKTWTFNLRQGVTWVDAEGNYKADVTSEDWVTGLEWVCNYWESEGKNASFATDTIEGALEYYEYTESLSEEEAMNPDYDLFMSMVGIETPDEYTIVYNCVDEVVYFDTLACYCVLYPLARGLVTELGSEGYKAVQPSQLWYNGAYIITEFTNNNEKTLTPNPSWWDTESTRFDSMTWKVVDSVDTAFLLFQSGEIDKIELTESAIRSIADNPSSEYYNNTVLEHMASYAGIGFFNFNKLNADGTPDTNWNTAAANDNFRKAFYYGIDFTAYLGRQNSLEPLASQGYTITGEGLASIDGVDYATYVEGLLGLDSTNLEAYDRYDAEKGAEYIAAAKEELAAAGVTFPIQMDYYIAASNQTALDTATVLKNNIEEYLGSDFVNFNICTYISSYQKEVNVPSLYSFRFMGWAADFGDPIAVLGLICTDKSGNLFAACSKVYDTTDQHIIDYYAEATELIRAADAIHDDMNERYKAFAEAEIYCIDKGIVFPFYKTSKIELTRINDYTLPMSGYGFQEYRYVNIETSTELYTIDDYAALAEAYEAGKVSR
jgi:oligopeptide transport system substrate-binding protein